MNKYYRDSSFASLRGLARSRSLHDSACSSQLSHADPCNGAQTALVNSDRLAAKSISIATITKRPAVISVPSSFCFPNVLVDMMANTTLLNCLCPLHWGLGLPHRFIFPSLACLRVAWSHVSPEGQVMLKVQAEALLRNLQHPAPNLIKEPADILDLPRLYVTVQAVARKVL